MRLFKTFLSVLALCFPLLCFAQKQSNWDETLDRYELICERCLELQKVKQQGGEVPKESLSSLMVQLTMLKRSLSEAQGQMSAAQKARFEMIRRRFGDRPETTVSQPSSGTSSKASESVLTQNAPAGIQTGSMSPEKKAGTGKAPLPVAPPEKPMQMDVERKRLDLQVLEPASAMPLPVVSHQRQAGLLPFFEVGRDHTVLDQGSFSRNDLSSGFFLALQTGVCPMASYGLRAGVTGKEWGFHASARSSFENLTASPEYSCNSDGIMSNGARIWFGGNTSRQLNIVSAGVSRKIGGTGLLVYSGAGYGSYSYYLQDVEGRWATVEDISCGGLALEIGLITNLGSVVPACGHLVLGVGCTAVDFRYSDLSVSLGWRF